MPNQIFIPKLNPVEFRPITPYANNQYLSKNYNQYRYHQTLQPWEEERAYYQKWMFADTLWMQFTSNFGDISYDVIDCTGYQAINPTNFQKVRSSRSFVGSYIYEAGLNWNFITKPGIYFVRLFLGGALSHISEPIVLATTHPGTMLVEYSCPNYHESMVFATGFRPQMRVECYIGRIQPGSKDQLFIDQSYDSRLISSKPYSAWEVTFGGPEGLPDWMIDKLNYIWSCNTVKLDGMEYSKESDADFEMVGSDRYPMRSFKMRLLEGVNRAGTYFEPTNINTNERLNITYNIDADVFGGQPVNNDSVIQVKEFE